MRIPQLTGENVELDHFSLLVQEKIPTCGESVLDSCATELTEEDTEELTALCEPPDGEYSDVVAKRPQLMTSL